MQNNEKSVTFVIMKYMNFIKKYSPWSIVEWIIYSYTLFFISVLSQIYYAICMS